MNACTAGHEYSEALPRRRPTQLDGSGSEWEESSSAAPRTPQFGRCAACGEPSTSAHPMDCLGRAAVGPAACPNSACHCYDLRAAIEAAKGILKTSGMEPSRRARTALRALEALG